MEEYLLLMHKKREEARETMGLLEYASVKKKKLHPTATKLQKSSAYLRQKKQS